MRTLLLAGLLLAAPFAQAAFEDLGAGARAPGMANAFVPVADDVYALHYNPAGLGLLERPMLGAAYTSLYPGLKDSSNLTNQFIGYAQPWTKGKSGIGVSLNSFALNSSLYRDDTLRMGYGRMFKDSPTKGQFYLGFTFDYLRSSFGGFSEAANAVPTGNVVGGGQADPVLSGSHSRTAMDADIGFLHKINPRYQWGFAISHIMQPNVAFSKSEADKLPMSMKLGLNYHSLISNLVGELDTAQSPAGGRDNNFLFGAERWFAKFLIGEFGVRGGLQFGARDQKSLSMGFSFRSRRLGADYALAVPFGGVSTTIGAHRVALNFRFGSATEEEESVEAVLEAMKQLKAGQLMTPKAPTKELSATQKQLLDEYLRLARSFEAKARYSDALDKMGEALQVAPADKELVARFGRLSFVGRQIKQLPDYRSDPAQAALHLGVLAYVAGDEPEAVKHVSYALSLKPEWRELDLFLSQLENATGVKRPTGAPKPDRDIMLRLTRANSAIEEGQYREAIELSLSVLRLESENATAWLNLGTAYFALKDYDSSLRSWRKAYDLEKTPAVKAAIRNYIRQIERVRKSPRPEAARPAAPAPDQGANAESPAGAPAEAAAPAPRVRATARPEAARPLPQKLITPAQEQTMLNEAVDAYTNRDFGRAKSLLETILENDPTNTEARKALQRVQNELP